MTPRMHSHLKRERKRCIHLPITTSFPEQTSCTGTNQQGGVAPFQRRSGTSNYINNHQLNEEEVDIYLNLIHAMKALMHFMESHMGEAASTETTT